MSYEWVDTSPKTGRPCNPICRYGHDKRIVGVTAHRQCAECDRKRNRLRVRKPRPSSRRWLPADPLLSVAPRPLWVLDDAAQRAIYRARARGLVTDRAADELAAKLNRHPSEIWGSEWYA